MFKILISYYQVLVPFKTNFHVPWPGFFVAYLSSLSFMNLGLGNILVLDCIKHGSNFYDILLLATLLPILGLVVIYASLRLRWYITNAVGQEREQTKGSHLKLALLVLFAIYPGVSATIVRTFKCRYAPFSL